MHRLIRPVRVAGMEVNGECDWKWVSLAFCELLNGVELLYRARKQDLKNIIKQDPSMARQEQASSTHVARSLVTVAEHFLNPK